jgi:hypothetical protein
MNLTQTGSEDVKLTEMVRKRCINYADYTAQNERTIMNWKQCEICALLGHYAVSCDRVVSTTRHRISQKSADLINIAAEA